MTMPKAHRVSVYCDAESHAPKVATVGKLKTGGGSPTYVGDWQESEREYLLDDEIVDHRDVYGTATRGPTPGYAGARERRVMECPLCGLRVEVRADKLHTLAENLAAADVSRVRLSALAANL